MTEGRGGAVSDHREAIAEWFHGMGCSYAGPRNYCSGSCDYYADALLGSDVLAQIRAEAWDEGVDHCEQIAGVGYNNRGVTDANPYRAKGSV